MRRWFRIKGPSKADWYLSLLYPLVFLIPVLMAMSLWEFAQTGLAKAVLILASASTFVALKAFWLYFGVKGDLQKLKKEREEAEQ